MSFLFDLAFFALLFFVLVFIHELGHFLMARLVGIRVEKFSIGMGPSLFSKKMGDTEYRLAALPLGGYVKMSGDEPGKDYTDEERQVGFLTKSPPQKLLVVFGGPVFNLILPLFVFGLLLAVGAPSVQSRIGLVEPEGVAAKAGLQTGDLILSVDGEPIKEWEEMEERVRSSAGKELRFEIERKSLMTGELETLQLRITPEQTDGLSRFGEPVQVGKIGVSPRFLVPRIYFEDPQSPIAQTEAQKFDRVVKVDGVEIRGLAQFQNALEMRSGQKTIELELEPEDGSAVRRVEVQVPSSNQNSSVFAGLGFLPIELVIGYVADKVEAPELEPKLGVCQDNTAPAKAAGLQEGDRLIAFGDYQLNEWEDLQKAVRSSAGEAKELKWSREGETMMASIAPLKTTIFDPIRGRDAPSSVDEVYRIGISPRLESNSAFFTVQSYNPIKWVTYGVTETVSLVTLTGEAMLKLVTGQLSMKSLGSPIMIFNVAGNSYRLAGGGSNGWLAFLRTLALLSITLGIVNLLPVPVLDGGHAVFFTIEWIRGRPLSLKFLEVATQVGLILLLGLFSVVLYNDVYRYDLMGGIMNNMIRATNAVFYGCA